ncbi:MAG: ATP synthase F1 subunit delta [Acidobacteria bacterium]|nr:ATP synthase F1 subunit delta [Acidobacteriota bacterium]
MKAVAQRYARALVDVALKQGQAEQVRKELSAFAAVVTQSAPLRSALGNPAIPRDKKQAILSMLGAQLGVGKSIHNFLMILVDNRRAQLLPQIREAYDQQLNLRLGVAEAEVTAPRELSTDEKARLIAALGKTTGKRVEATYRQDATLIGGTIVRVGSTIYNGSVRDQLNRLQTKLMED